MILNKDFKEGDKLWYMKIRFSTSSSRVIAVTPPTEVIVMRTNYHIFLQSVENEKLLIHIDEYSNYGGNLFWDEEDCRQEWESRFLNEIDKVQYKYEKMINYLRKYIKKGIKK